MQREEGKLFVGGLSWNTDQEMLREYFSKYGEVSDAVVMRNTETGKSRGFGFISFRDPSVAEICIQAKHTIDNRQVDAKPCNTKSGSRGGSGGSGGAGGGSGGESGGRGRGGPRPQRPEYNAPTNKIFIGGIPASATEDSIKNTFNQYGNVTEVVIMMDKEAGRSRGFGFLTFETEESVDQVCQLHYVILDGKKVECKRAEPRSGRNGPGMGRGGGDRGSGGPPGQGFQQPGQNWGGMGGGFQQGFQQPGYGGPPVNGFSQQQGQGYGDQGYGYGQQAGGYPQQQQWNQGGQGAWGSYQAQPGATTLVPQPNGAKQPTDSYPIPSVQSLVLDESPADSSTSEQVNDGPWIKPYTLFPTSPDLLPLRASSSPIPVNIQCVGKPDPPTDKPQSVPVQISTNHQSLPVKAPIEQPSVPVNIPIDQPRLPAHIPIDQPGSPVNVPINQQGLPIHIPINQQGLPIHIPIDQQGLPIDQQGLPSTLIGRSPIDGPSQSLAPHSMVRGSPQRHPLSTQLVAVSTHPQSAAFALHPAISQSGLLRPVIYARQPQQHLSFDSPSQVVCSTQPSMAVYTTSPPTTVYAHPPPGVAAVAALPQTAMNPGPRQSVALPVQQLQAVDYSQGAQGYGGNYGGQQAAPVADPYAGQQQPGSQGMGQYQQEPNGFGPNRSFGQNPQAQFGGPGGGQAGYPDQTGYGGAAGAPGAYGNPDAQQPGYGGGGGGGGGSGGGGGAGYGAPRPGQGGAQQYHPYRR